MKNVLVIALVLAFVLALFGVGATPAKAFDCTAEIAAVRAGANATFYTDFVRAWLQRQAIDIRWGGTLAGRVIIDKVNGGQWMSPQNGEGVCWQYASNVGAGLKPGVYLGDPAPLIIVGAPPDTTTRFVPLTVGSLASGVIYSSQ